MCTLGIIKKYLGGAVFRIGTKLENKVRQNVRDTCAFISTEIGLFYVSLLKSSIHYFMILKNHLF